MKIRKANMNVHNQLLSNVYIYENKKEEYSLVAIPELEWSMTVKYEEERSSLRSRLTQSFEKKIDKEDAEQLAEKIVQWTAEM
ncbi:YueH family protein [Metabacillus fastidiosus]|uniref:YueH family protein n=1 Tax=Metabacillus fastidiosus TaxID=1458 RepID=A0ABU6P0Z7_9BACI|nr:YueH family protein [Metabacillus fastidiosus]MEC2078305.1 YueH family protein [Metabacillus fastidiosus]MED4403011.1 YueH family protein [Metabacillus fastidiosus]MED4455241.1 YueH family protein [Metabacillus fastidiosus]MED4461429.1 YueH family protein [Metabacillus fastidiosus]MED4533836.1 YueH family protein [Metabacillus fastidiosus]